MIVPIRWKLIVLLGTLSIAPLLLVAWHDVKTLATLGSRLASQAGQALSDQARESLERQADDFARLIALERKMLELIVRLQAREITDRLRGSKRFPQAAFWHADTASDRAFPGAQDLPEVYFQQVSPRKRVPVPVTFTHLALHAAPGVARAAVEAEGQRLAGAISFLSALRTHESDLVYWHFTALENGLHASYPGHSGYPANYDPRERPWYQAQRTRRELTWSRPQTDVTSRLTMISATLPLFDTENRFIGVTGIDVPVTRMLRAVRPAAELAPHSQVLLTIAGPKGAPAPGIEILARQDYVDQGGDWREKTQVEYFTADQAQVTREILADMRAGEDGFKRLSYRGKAMFCVYRRFDAHSTYLVFLVPTAAAAQPAAAAAQYALETTRRQVDALIPLIVIVALATVVAALLGARAVTGPIQRLMAAVRAVAEGDFNVRVDIRSGDELEQLGAHFNQMIPQMAAHAQMKQALAVAREVQQRLLPGAAPASDVLDIHGICLYAEETGGDYYDYLSGPQTADDASGTLGIAIGDVSGHGIGSALLMTTARAFLHANDFQGADLAGELCKLNVNLADDVHAGRFMTLCVMVFDISQRTVHWASAGHDPVLCYDRALEAFVELAGDDIPLGIDRHWQFSLPGHRTFATGDVFVLATDGVWETRAPDGARFGKHRLRECILRHLDSDAEAICAAIVEAVARFRGSQPPHDDMTVVVVRIKPPPAVTRGHPPPVKTVTVDSKRVLAV